MCPTRIPYLVVTLTGDRDIHVTIVIGIAGVSVLSARNKFILGRLRVGPDLLGLFTLLVLFLLVLVLFLPFQG